MPICPKCHTWNPDDRTICWRCGAELPRPEEKKEKKRYLLFGLSLWTWVFIIVLMIASCLGPYLLTVFNH